MSAATASSTETATVHVRLLNDGVDEWRPVEARRLSGSAFRRSNAMPHQGEAWGVNPGDVVVAEHGGSDGRLVAVARATDIGERSQAALSIAS